MGFYDRYSTSALRLISKYGMAITLRVVSPGAADFAAGTRGASTFIDYPIKAIEEEYKISEIDGTLITRKDKKLIVAAKNLAVEPTPGNTIIYPSGEIWTIAPTTSGNLSVKPVAPGGVPLVYVIQIRK